MREAITKRISRRNYLQKPIARKARERILREVDELNRESGLSFPFVEEAGAAFNSMKRLYGMFSGVYSVLIS